MDKKITIAIDGFSSCGKSTIARQLAEKLGYIYIDTGAMYRTVTYYLMENNIDPHDSSAIERALKDIRIDFQPVNGRMHVHLNGVDVEEQIRQMDVSKKVSEVSTVKAVREKLVASQQEMGENGGVVMDGRDIGTNVLPNAELKIFMTAGIDVRVERRYKELKNKGLKVRKEEIRKNLQERDYLDANRKENPLRRADDAWILDNSEMDQEEQLNWVMEKTKKKVKIKN